MKLKVDFVTNSSSSSFVVMGAYIDGSLLTDTILEKVREEWDKPDLEMDEIRRYPMDYIESLFSKLPDFNFSGGHPYGDGIPMVGIPYPNMKENETKAQFRQRVKDGIKSALGIEVEVSHIEECWEDR